MAVLMVAAMVAALASPARAARVALVIGNDNYQAAAKLRNARADAQAMQRALSSVRFDRVELRTDLNRASMLAALREFKARVQPGDDVVVFFSGHGVQVEGTSYLLTTDTRPGGADDVRDSAVSLQRVLDDMAERKPAFTLVIVDACRENVFPGRRTTGAGGLAPTARANGQMIIYSAGAGQTALDSLGSDDPVPNGLFTRIFVQEMLTPGLRITQMVDRVRERVRQQALAVRHQQVPALYSEAIGDFYFVPPPAGGQPAPAAAEAGAQDQVARYKALRDSTDAGALQAYLDAYGDKALFGDEVRARLLQVQRARQTRTPGAAFRDCEACPEMVVIPGGSLKLASTAAGPAPVDVQMPRPFAVGRHEVSFAEWDACVADGGCAAVADDEGWGRGRRPVVNVSWRDAMAYVRWLSARTGVTYRLPGELEWTYAAAAGSSAKYPWGRTLEAGMANCIGCGALEYERRRTAPVGSFKPNAFGLHDTIGNVWEWVADCFAPRMSLASGTPPPMDCPTYAARGGAYDSDAAAASLEGRLETLGRASPRIGFRVARDL